jgi:hypothetical protein
MLGMFGDSEFPTIQLHDEQERPRATLQVGPDGRSVFSLQDEGGGGLVSLGANPTGEIGLSILRPGNVPGLQVSWSESEGLRLSVWNSSGQPMWQGFEPGIPMHRDSDQSHES